MFSKTRTTESGPQFNDIPETTTPPKPSETATSAAPPIPSPAPKKAKPAASVLSSDITITGNVRSSGDIQIEGNIEGDVRAQTLIVGETATVKGEVIADEVITHGRVIVACAASRFAFPLRHASRATSFTRRSRSRAARSSRAPCSVTKIRSAARTIPRRSAHSRAISPACPARRQRRP